MISRPVQKLKTYHGRSRNGYTDRTDLLMKCYNCQAANVPCVYEHTKLFLLVYRHGSEQSSFYSHSARRVVNKLREIPQDSTYSLYVHDMFTGEDTPLETARLEPHGDFYLTR